MIDRQHQRRERAFHRRVLVKIVDDDLRIGIALELDHHPGVFVGLVAHRGDVGDDFFVHQLGDAFNERRAIHVVRNLGDDDLLFAALDFFDADFAAHFHAAAAGRKILFDALDAADHATRRKIRAL